MENKKVIKLTESELHNIIKESVTNILKEIGETPKGQYALGAVKGRALGRTLYQPEYQRPSKRNKQGEIMDKAYFKAYNHRNENPEEMENMVGEYRKGYDYGMEKAMKGK